MSVFCKKCGAVILSGGKFCPDCGANQDEVQPVQATQYPTCQNAQQQESSQTQPNRYTQQPTYMQQNNNADIHSSYDRLSADLQTEPTPKPFGTWKILGNLLLMGIPVFGLILSIVRGAKRAESDRRNLARAMIVISIIQHIIYTAAIFAVLFMLKQIATIVDLEIVLFGIKIF